MPCHYDPPEVTTANPAKILNASELEAVLCGVFTVLDNEGVLARTLNHIDWKEVGVDDDKVADWWEKHQEEDNIRRAKEKALKKLTPAERKLLGL